MKMKQFKKLVVSALLICTVFTFTACSNKNKGGDLDDKRDDIREDKDHNGVVDDVEDIGRDVVDGVEDIGEDIKDGAEDVVDGNGTRRDTDDVDNGTRRDTDDNVNKNNNNNNNNNR